MIIGAGQWTVRIDIDCLICSLLEYYVYVPLLVFDWFSWRHMLAAFQPAVWAYFCIMAFSKD